MPEHFRKRVSSEWGDANQERRRLDGFIEGPVVDADGNLYVVDIPHGRIFRVSTAREWELIIEYDGWPNGLAWRGEHELLIADYRLGLLSLDVHRRELTTVLSSRVSEGFKGLNDLCVGRDGAVYFTDQGQTGMHDPTGRLYRLSPDQRLDCLIDNIPSPNGLVLAPDESFLYLAVTRANAVWRVPFVDHGVSKVGVFCQLFGPGGPDGLALDAQGNLFVAHVGLGSVFVYSPLGVLHSVIGSSTGRYTTNLTLARKPDGGDTLFITESESNTVLCADWPPL